MSNIFNFMIVLGKEIDCKDRGKWLAMIEYTLICDIHRMIPKRHTKSMIDTVVDSRQPMFVSNRSINQNVTIRISKKILPSNLKHIKERGYFCPRFRLNV